MQEAPTLDYRGGPGGQAEPDPVVFGLPASVWVKIGLVTVLFCAVFWPNLRRLWEKTNLFTGEANWGHSTLVPIIGLYYLYVNRDELRARKAHASWTGLPILLLGLLLFGYGIWPGQNDWIKDFGMVVSLFGLVLLLAGWSIMGIAWFPIAFLICAIPWSPLLYSKVALPLQQLASEIAVTTLKLTQVEAFNSGTHIYYYVFNGGKKVQRDLNVEEACAGLRSLMTFISVAAAIAFLSSRPFWQKVIVVASAVPIAIFWNVMRVSGQGLLDRYCSQELSKNFAHEFVGLLMLLPAFLFILMVGWLLDRIFIEEVENRQEVLEKVIRRNTAAATAQAPASSVSPLRNAAPLAPLDGAARPEPARPAARPTRSAGLTPPPSVRLATWNFSPRGVPPKPAPPRTAE
jgi:exosortase